MSGLASLTVVGDDVLHYREDGRMRLANGDQLAAYADYLFAQTGAGRLVMSYAETPPRLFQRFDLVLEADGLAGESRHLCGADTYVSRLVFAADGSWRLSHDVSGPRKSYRSLTLYRRV